MKYLILVLSVVVLNGCIQELIWPGESRIQWVNASDGHVQNLKIKAYTATQDSIVLVPEMLEAGERSRVYTHDLSGVFTLELEREVPCAQELCFASLQFEGFVLDGGSIVLRYKNGAEGPLLKQD